MCGHTVDREVKMVTKKNSTTICNKKANQLLLSNNQQPSKVFSNDPTKSCKTFCCECDQVVTLSGLRKHVKSKHQMTHTEYKAMYGNPRKQIIQLVYHLCWFCQATVLLDTDDLSKHLKKAHQTAFKEYLVKYMTKNQTKVMHVKEKKAHTLKKVIDAPLVVIRCDECPKTFKQNIQLKIHKRKHSSN